MSYPTLGQVRSLRVLSRSCRLFCLALPAFFPSLLVAEKTTNLILDPVIVTADRSESSLLRSGVAMTVIGSREISNLGYVKPIEFLRMVPGLSIGQNGSIGGGASSVFIRGAKSEQTLVMMDGIILNDPSSLGRSAAFESLNMANVDRIEVLRGSQGAVYGSDAMGGIINLISRGRTPGLFHPKVSVEYGSLNTLNIGMGLRGSTTWGEYDVNGSWESTSGASKAEEVPGSTNMFKPNPHTNLTVSGRFKVIPAEGMSLVLSGRYAGNATSIDGGAFSDSTNKTVDGTSAQLAAIWEQDVTAPFHFRASYAYSRSMMTNMESGLFGFNNLLVGIGHQAGLMGVLKVASHQVHLGADWRMELMDSVSSWASLTNARASMAGVYAQGLLDFEDLTVQLSGRGEYHERFGLVGTFHGGLAYQAPFGLRLAASGGRAFKAPTLYQLFDLSYGSSNLQPESGYTADVTVGWVATNFFRFSITGFLNDFSQQIDFVSTGAFSYAYTNLSGARTMGLELETRVTPAREVSFGAQYSFVDARDMTTGQFLTRRAAHSGSVYADARIWNRLQLGISCTVTGNRYDSPYYQSPTNVTLDPYVKLDARVAFDVLPNLTLHLRGENLLDQKVMPVYGYKNPGVLFFGGVSFGL